MSTGGTLFIRNQFGFPITIYVSQANWNCCDSPIPGQAVAYLAPMDGTTLAYIRKDGHGCNGNQGLFQIDINIAMSVKLDFDSNGVMNPTPTFTGCKGELGGEPGNYTLLVYALP